LQLQDVQGKVPYAVNLVVHRTNPRLKEDLAVCVDHKVPLVITSVGKPSDVVAAVKAYGGVIYHDVATTAQGLSAVACGIDGLILLCAGAGGQTGTLNPFSFLEEVREYWSGDVIISGGIATGRGVRAVQALGAAYAYIGTLFAATQESIADPGYKELLVASSSKDIVAVAGRFGALTSIIRKTLLDAGLPEQAPGPGIPVNLNPAPEVAAQWASVRSAGQGVGSVRRVAPVAEIIERLVKEYEASSQNLK
jgi:nitronate monooxygenase